MLLNSSIGLINIIYTTKLPKLNKKQQLKRAAYEYPISMHAMMLKSLFKWKKNLLLGDGEGLDLLLEIMGTDKQTLKHRVMHTHFKCYSLKKSIDRFYSADAM